MPCYMQGIFEVNMKFKQIQDMQASVIGFGCWAIGGTWNNVTDAESIKTVHSAVDQGINFLMLRPFMVKVMLKPYLVRQLKPLRVIKSLSQLNVVCPGILKTRLKKHERICPGPVFSLRSSNLYSGLVQTTLIYTRCTGQIQKRQ